jgi:aryl-alcohol dehydrogenase-like predicted oxidoreductase
MWDWNTDIYDIMDGLNRIVKAGKARYIGISNSFDGITMIPFCTSSSSGIGQQNRCLTLDAVYAMIKHSVNLIWIMPT